MISMKLTCLIENLTYRGGLVGEHGLAFHLDTGTHRVLFDTGQTGAFVRNAGRLGVNIADVDALVISHGHYDHTGGVSAFLAANSKAKVYLKREALWPKFNGTKSIGFEYKHLDVAGRLSFVEDSVEIAPGVSAVGSIPVIDPGDTHWKYFVTQDGDQRVQDTFKDELFLTIVSQQKLSVLSSCSHCGITNIMHEATRRFGLPVGMIAGGFHLKDAHPTASVTVSKMLEATVPARVGVCHCTGLDHYMILKNKFPTQVFYFHTGVMMEI